MLEILDRATIADLIGVELPVAPHSRAKVEAAITGGMMCEVHGEPWGFCADRHPAPEEILAWARRTFPEADDFERHAFAEVVYSHATGLSGPWSITDQGRPRERKAERILREARGDLGTGIVESVRVDAEGRHAPLPGMTLADWTRWIWARLVALYFQGEIHDRPA